MTPHEIAALAAQLNSLKSIDWTNENHLTICHANPSDCQDIATDLARAITEAGVPCSISSANRGHPGHNAQKAGMWLYVGVGSLKSAGKVIQAGIKDVLNLDVALFGPWPEPEIHCIYLFVTRKTGIGEFPE